MADLVYMARSAWTALLDSIRSKGGTSALMAAAQAKAAVEAIETGGGGGNAQFESGTITVASTVSVPKSGMLFPGLQLSFVPDYLEIWMDRDSFDAIETPVNNYFYRIVAHRTQATYPPYRFSTTASGDTTIFSGDWWFEYGSNVAAFSSPLSGYGMSSWSTIVDISARPAWNVNADGTLTIARFSSATPALYAGTYHYVAYKGETA